MHPLLDEEAMRVVKLLPKKGWKPGQGIYGEKSILLALVANERQAGLAPDGNECHYKHHKQGEEIIIYVYLCVKVRIKKDKRAVNIHGDQSN